MYRKINRVRIRELRADRKWDQGEMARRIGKSRNAVSDIERGKFSPSYETVQKMAEAFGVHIDSLFVSAIDYENLPLPDDEKTLLRKYRELNETAKSSVLQFVVGISESLAKRK